MKSTTNIAASVHHRLLNLHRQSGRLFNELLQYYAMERFLYRLSQSNHSGKFVLKGALMLRAWGSSEFRSTMDIDLLGRTNNNIQNIESLIRGIISQEVTPDGIVFDPESIRSETITEDAEYEGIRVTFKGFLGSARINMQIDIGFGDIVFPEPHRAELPTLLDFPAPDLLCYSRESSIAEKFEAMVSLGVLNSRMKDFYDIWLLSRLFDFEGKVLLEAVKRTFENRKISLNKDIEAFTPDFAQSKQVQWDAFRKRMKMVQMPEIFAEVTTSVGTFILPVVDALRKTTQFTSVWNAPGPWLPE